MNPHSVAIAFNPMSGSFSQSRLDTLSDAFAAAGFEPRFVDSYSAELAVVAANSAHLCVVGGDGTLRDVFARLGNEAELPRISIFPTGTINLVAREALHSRDIGKFVSHVTAGHQPQMHFLSEVNGKPMLVCASVGPDSMAVASVSAELKSRIGRFAYVAALARLLYKWPRHALIVKANGECFQCEAAFVLKGRFFAGPWQLSRDASLSDPAFQLLLLPRARRRDYLRLILSVTVMPSLASKRWLRMRTETVQIEGVTGLPVQVDGDIMATLPITASIHPRPIHYS
jgi:diacylglycerol kinase family enzyme